jgi:hypothetical protein
MLAAVVGKVAVVVVDHRDARTHEARDREDGDPGAQRERGVGVPQVVEIAWRLDAGSSLSGLPAAAAEASEVDPTTARVREQNLVL